MGLTTWIRQIQSHNFYHILHSKIVFTVFPIVISGLPLPLTTFKYSTILHLCNPPCASNGFSLHMSKPPKTGFYHLFHNRSSDNLIFSLVIISLILWCLVRLFIYRNILISTAPTLLSYWFFTAQ